MLTIQPNLADRSVRQVTFRADAGSDNRLYEEKTHYYEKQVKDFEDALENKDTPETLKKIIKVFKVVSEALLEGWAVAWGAKKGSDVIKSPIMKGVNSKYVKGAGKVFKNIGEGLGSVASVVANAYRNVKASKFMTENSLGKVIAKGLDYAESAAKYVGKTLSGIFGPVKEAKFENIYDKVTNITSKTFGVGAGAAGAYNAATGADKADNAEEISETDEDRKFPKDGE